MIWGTEDECDDYFCETDNENDGLLTGLWAIAQELSLQEKYKEAAEVARKIANLPERVA